VAQGDPEHSWQRVRYRRQRVARKILGWRSLQGCQHCHAHNTKTVAVWRSQPADGGRGGAWFTGLQTCGLVWVCPVCAERISRGRRRELQEAADAAGRLGYRMVFVTLTVRHNRGMRLRPFLADLAKARGRMTGWRAYRKIRSDWGSAGQIRALEVTHGENGWHPHLHELFFVRHSTTEADLAELQARIYTLWADACRRVGLPEPDPEHGVLVQGGEAAGDYISKWGIDDEMAGSAKKQGRQGGRTPWQLLDGATENPRDAALFREYAEAFRGRRQLHYSRGLREAFSLAPEQADLELATDPPPEAVQVASIDPATWLAVQQHRAQPAVLEIAERCPGELEAFFRRLRRESFYKGNNLEYLYSLQEAGKWAYLGDCKIYFGG